MRRLLGLQKAAEQQRGTLAAACPVTVWDNRGFPLAELAGWTSKTWGSTWPGCTTSTCSLLASMSWNHGKNPSLTLFSSLPLQWWSTPHTCSYPSTCAWLWSFSLGSLAANRKAPWHSWPKARKEKGGKKDWKNEWFVNHFHVTLNIPFFTWTTNWTLHQDWKHEDLAGMIWKPHSLFF